MIIIYFTKNEKSLYGRLSVSLIIILQNHNVTEHKKASVTKIFHAIYNDYRIGLNKIINYCIKLHTRKSTKNYIPNLDHLHSSKF